MSNDESSFDNSQAISNAFANYFSLVYINSQSFNAYLPILLPEHVKVSFLDVILSEVFAGLTRIG